MRMTQHERNIVKVEIEKLGHAYACMETRGQVRPRDQRGRFVATPPPPSSRVCRAVRRVKVNLLRAAVALLMLWVFVPADVIAAGLTVLASVVTVVAWVLMLAVAGALMVLGHATVTNVRDRRRHEALSAMNGYRRWARDEGLLCSVELWTTIIDAQRERMGLTPEPEPGTPGRAA